MRNPSSKTVVFAGGGTGGHLFPALAVAESLRSREPGIRIVFLVTDRPGDTEAVSAAGCEAVVQPIRPVPRRLGEVAGFLKAWFQSRRLCRNTLVRERPFAVVGAGGYGCGAAVTAAARLRIPVALLNPDFVPGRANRFLARKAQIICAQWPGTEKGFRGGQRVAITGCPVRSAFLSADRRLGIERFGLDPSRKTLLVTGASQGARTINWAMIELIDFLAAQRKWQVLHLTGRQDHERVAEAYRPHPGLAHVVAFTPDMGEAMAASDLVVSRAGASTLAELTAMGLPSILLPYPYHKDQHQRANAQVLVDQGAAEMLIDEIDPKINAPKLKQALSRLMNNDEARCLMAAAARGLAVPDSAAKIADCLLEFISGGAARGRQIGKQGCPPSPIGYNRLAPLK